MLKQLLAKKPVHDLEATAKSDDLHRTLGPWTLAAIGIGGIIGTGIFVLTGIAAANNAGPALALTYAPGDRAEFDIEWVVRVGAIDDPDFGSASRNSMYFGSL